jgi:signal transduction histidine kinase
MDKIVSDLQAYADPRILRLTPVNLEQLLNESILIAQIPSNINLSINVTEEPVLADQSIIRVFVNLILNAIQSMPNGGELTIWTVREGKQVLIHFQDTGIGIPKEHLQKIFDPLFTTKAQGQGLGLAVCKRLVEAHEGTITVESTVGKGSTFTVKLKHER